MLKKFVLYRSQLLFIGLVLEEVLKVDTIFSRYIVYYKDSFSLIDEHYEQYDFLCVTEADFHKNSDKILDSKIPFVIIGERKVPGCIGLLMRSQLVFYWHEFIKEIIPAVKLPKTESIEIGVIVRSKTTPLFGKGVITEVISENEVMVKFPTNKLLPKDKAIRCHKSQLQILGKMNEEQ